MRDSKFKEIRSEEVEFVKHKAAPKAILKGEARVSLIDFGVRNFEVKPTGTGRSRVESKAFQILPTSPLAGMCCALSVRDLLVAFFFIIFAKHYS